MLYPCTAPHPADLSLLSARVALIYPCSAPASRSFIPAQRPRPAALSLLSARIAPLYPGAEPSVHNVPRDSTLGPKRSRGTVGPGRDRRAEHLLGTSETPPP